MRRRLCAGLTALCLLLPAVAAAYSAVTTSSATLYDYAPGESPEDESAAWLVKGTVPQGTTINVSGTQSGKYHITYSGGEGYINGGTFERSDAATGTTDETEGGQTDAGTTGTGTGTTGSGTTTKRVVKKVTPAWTVRYDEEDVVLLTPGSYQCIIRTGSGQETVLTSDLDWASEEEAAKAVAVVNKKSKVASVPLLSEKAVKSEVLTHIPYASVILVEKTGSKFCRVEYNGYTGFVKTMYLNFTGIAEEGQSGVVAYNGKTSGKTTVNLRSGRGRKYRKIAEFATGTPLTVLDYGTNWSKVEIGGYRGYMDNDYIQLD